MRHKRSTVASLACLALASPSAPVLAQAQAPAASEPAILSTVPSAAPAANAAPQADAENQAQPPRRAWSIVPRISVVETLTDNVLLRNSDKRSDQITQVSPGILIDGESARAKLHLDYARSESYYAQDTYHKRSLNSLNAIGKLEAIEKWLYVDVTGIIAQQAISPIGTLSPSTASVNANQTETSNFRVNPYIRGTLAGLADYQFGYSRSLMHARSTSAYDIDTGEWSGRIGNSKAFKNLGWALDASKQRTDYSNGGRIDADTARATLSYQFGPQYRLSVIGGYEDNNYTTLNKESHSISGFGFDWTPDERTRLSAERQRRFFGESHTFTFDHRTPLTVWKFSDSRNISILPTQLATVTLGTVYDLLYSQLASRVPDPQQRALAVNELLQAYNLPANTVVTSGFLSSSASVQRRRDLSLMLTGKRNTVTFMASENEYQRLQTLNGSTDAFLNTNQIRQRGFTVDLAHRLTPLSTLNVVGSRQHASTASSDQESTLRMLDVSLSTRFSPNTTGSLAARRALFHSTASPYSESAIVGTLTAQF